MNILATTAGTDRAAAQLHEQAVAFEGLFMQILLRTMREGVKANERFHGGRGEEIFNGLMDSELGTRMAERGGLGIAEMVEKALDVRA